MISEELAAFFESGLAMYVAARDADLAPFGARAWAAVVDGDREHVTVFVHRPAGARLLALFEAHPEAAVLFSRPTDDRSCQAKGAFVAARPARAGERAIVERQSEGFARELEAVGIPREATAQWRNWPCLTLRFRITALFQQTPGPGAGEPLR